MTFKEIKELIGLVSESDLKEFRLKNKEFEIRMRTAKDTPPQFAGPLDISQASPFQAHVISPGGQDGMKAEENNGGEVEATESINYKQIKSPMVGTFYRSPSSDKPPYVQVGDSIANGGVVCIIEAMKLFNEIESEISGKIVKVLVEDASPVEYDQVLFLVDTHA